jgi:Na+-transporting methylmalonyl-CoA/oxaloacetate decarboxylase gamma subunit
MKLRAECFGIGIVFSILFVLVVMIYSWQHLMAKDCIMISTIQSGNTADKPIIIQTPTKYHSCNSLREFSQKKQDSEFKTLASISCKAIQ